MLDLPVDLEAVPLFVGLQKSDLRAIADKALIRNVPKDSVVILEGEFTGSLYVILSGRVKVCLGDENGKELILDIKGAGGYFGEMALDEHARSASVVTITACRFAVISKTCFAHLLLDHPEVSLHLIKDLIHIVRGLNKNARTRAMLDIYGRVSKMLIDLAVDDGGTLVISEKLTQQDMANRVGSSRETINRIFRDLSLGGYIKVEGKKITINKTLPSRW